MEYVNAAIIVGVLFLGSAGVLQIFNCHNVKKAVSRTDNDLVTPEYTKAENTSSLLLSFISLIAVIIGLVSVVLLIGMIVVGALTGF